MITADDEEGVTGLPGATPATSDPPVVGAVRVAGGLQQHLDAVTERRPGPGHPEPDGGQLRPDGLSGEMAEADDGPQAVGDEPELCR